MRGGFLTFSAEITAFTVFELRGTGMADAYFETVSKTVGDALFDELLSTYAAIEVDSQAMRSDVLRRAIFDSEKLGPVARNIIKLWYMGIWEPLPPPWIQSYGRLATKCGFMVSATAYTEGLLWVAIGANPPGA